MQDKAFDFTIPIYCMELLDVDGMLFNIIKHVILKFLHSLVVLFYFSIQIVKS